MNLFELPVDRGRILLTAQGDAMRNLTGNIEGRTAGSISRGFSNNANGVFSATGKGEILSLQHPHQVHQETECQILILMQVARFLLQMNSVHEAWHLTF